MKILNHPCRRMIYFLAPRVCLNTEAHVSLQTASHYVYRSARFLSGNPRKYNVAQEILLLLHAVLNREEVFRSYVETCFTENLFDPSTCHLVSLGP